MRRVLLILIGLTIFSLILNFSLTKAQGLRNITSTIQTSTLKTQKLGEIKGECEHLIFSPDGKKFACLAREGGEYDEYGNYIGGKEFVILNGVEGKRYERIIHLQFSQDGRRLAYVVREGEKYFVIVDGTEGKRYDHIWGLQFSPDGEEIVYIAEEKIYDGAQYRGEKYFVVVNGKEGKKYDRILDLKFSSDGKKLVYVTEEVSIIPYYHIVVNGKEIKTYENLESIKVEPNTLKVAYIIRGGLKGDKYFLVSQLDNKIFGPYDHIYNFEFSPDGKKLAFVARRGNNIFFILNGKVIKKYNWLDKENFLRFNLKFSPDSKRLAVVIYNETETGVKMFAIIDSKETPKYAYIDEFSLQFSPDGKKIAYIVGEKGGYATRGGGYQGGKRFVVVNGIEGKRYDLIEGLKFSPDSRKLAYIAKEGGKYYTNEFFSRFLFYKGGKAFVVVNGKEGERYDEIYNLNFTPDSKKLFYNARIGNEIWLIVEDLK